MPRARNTGRRLIRNKENRKRGKVISCPYCGKKIKLIKSSGGGK